MPGDAVHSRAEEPFIALAEKAARALRGDMLANSHLAGYAEIQPAHNAVFATLPARGARAVDMAARAGVTRQSMGESIRDMVRLGLLEMVPDPEDGRAKIVRFTERGQRVAAAGLAHIDEQDRRFRDVFGDADYAAARRVLQGVRELLEGGRAT